MTAKASGTATLSAETKAHGLHKSLLAVAEPFLPPGFDGEERLLSNRKTMLVLRLGNIVVKAHPPETDLTDLNARLAAIKHKTFQDLFLQPLQQSVVNISDCFVTIWPAGSAPIADNPESIDWESSAKLLGALHAVPFAGIFAEFLFPKTRWLSRLFRTHSSLLALKNRPEKRIVLTAFTTLPNIDSKVWSSPRRCFIHGDWHPGQVVSIQGSPRLIDIDDIGIGDPSWDLARPAAWRLSGLLSDAAWKAFLESYREASGSAIEERDPWKRLELPARAAVIQAAETALIYAERDGRQLEDYELALIDTCSRIGKIFS